MSGSGSSPPASASKPDSTNADADASEQKANGEAASASEPDRTNAANAGQGAAALSSAAGTGQIALANVGGRASQPATSHVPRLAINLKRDVFNPLLGQCWWDYSTGMWRTPATEPDARLHVLDWQNMLKLPPGWTPTNFVPTFFHDEPDANQRDTPRLDIVVSFDNGVSARYHPIAFPIWSFEPQPTDAMQKRRNRAKHLGR